MYYPSLEEVKKYQGSGNLVPVYREIIADLETPVTAFLKIDQGGYSFLLESVEGGQRLARYSFIGTDPYRIIKIDKDNAVDPLPIIAKELNNYIVVPVSELPRFCGGAVGYLGYEVINRFEKLPSPENDQLKLPESMFMFVDTLLVFDHVTHKVKALSFVRIDGNIEQAYQEAVDKIEALVSRLAKPLKAEHYDKLNSQPVNDGEITSNISRAKFETGVQKIKQFITSGEAIQVVLSQRLAKPTKVEPFAVYRALRTINPSPYMFYLNFKDFQLVGASPEILVRVEDGKVVTRPLAGTRPRGKTVVEDIKLEHELKNDEKERAEHIMLVDLGRNDIGRVSEAGTVEVSELMDVERYSHVMHLVTNVQGKLSKDKNAFDALRACFPAGTVSGAPKIRAMEIIAGIEPSKRGPYAGAVGYFSFLGDMDMAIAIRTLVMKQGFAYVQAGGGIVYDSIPEKEYEESMNKARALLNAVKQAESSS
ncbi:MAG: anthranilate synthase component I [Dehalococcoidales bacterium]|nr:anthranilate synthase component I [Dehalococcoidales bacterium]